MISLKLMALCFLQSGLICSAELRLVDINTGMNFTIENSRLAIIGNSITFSSQLLTSNRHYTITIYEYEIEVASEMISKLVCLKYVAM